VSDSATPDHSEALHRPSRWRNFQKGPIVRHPISAIECHPHLKCHRLIALRRIDCRNTPSCPRLLQRLRLAVHSAKLLCPAVAHVLLPGRYRVRVALDLEDIECRIEALHELEIWSWQHELETAGCVGDVRGKALELYAGCNLAFLGDLAAEHEQSACVVEMRDVIVWVSLV
jgi:hypothetical protein